ncbi:LisH [Nesidiocoris tenuis]|uniref:LisH n=1 Tax=Nesidiocoris tenuis TaxID=355587 RepID=A0ABN7BAQ2_9HEMI|nr:LisH [Nesidiocoris tenuis]
MYAKGKGQSVPSNAQAREKLALYVYEYLLHVGAQRAAQTFLSEIRWERNITLGEPPGFLHSWWCVFWDLYCAAPERRDTNEHSSEAKAFHEYGFVNSGAGGYPAANGTGGPSGAGPMPQMAGPHGDGMPPGGGPGMPPGFFPNSAMRMSPSSQPSPHPPHASSQNDMISQPFMGGPRYPGPRPGGVRMPQMGEFNGMGGPMNPRMRGPCPPMGPNGGPYGPRGPPQMGPGGPMHPMMGGHPRPWPPQQNPSAPMSYSSPSPGGNYGPGGQNPMQSPHHPDSNPNANENMYMMKPGNRPDYPENGPMSAMSSNMTTSMASVMGDGMEMKNSPAGPGTPRDDNGGPSGMSDYNLAGFGGPPPPDDQNESAAIMKIKESMQEEAKRFEKDDHPDYFMQ